MNRFEEPFYRDLKNNVRWHTFRVKVETSDLYIRAHCELFNEAKIVVEELREQLRTHIAMQPDFLSALSPIPRLEDVPEIIAIMYEASEKAKVGPMAAVAGAIAQCVGKKLLSKSNEIIVENGGDIWLHVNLPTTIGLYAGNSAFSSKIGLKVYPHQMPMGICTSSAKVGHSFSFGNADAVTICACDAALADAIATETCNRVKNENDIVHALNYALSIDGVCAAIIVLRDKIGIKGDVELVDIS
ncbi:MAG: UPF0280 family protein [Spirochaetes bacterium]|nr:UPF0280 family protein [Spirochaetota bacterium]